MKEWILGVKPDTFDLIQKNIKVIEGRTPDPNIPSKDYRKLKKDDILVFLKEDESQEISKYKIKYIKHYFSVKEMLSIEGLNNVLPLLDSIDEGIDKYNSFPNYSQRINEFGIYAIAIGNKL